MVVSFVVWKLFSLIRSHLSILAFVAIAFGVLVMKSLPISMQSKKKNEFMSFAGIWMKLEAITLSELTQKQKLDPFLTLIQKLTQDGLKT